MKKILSLLMCYVFLQAETFALRGGPTGHSSVKVLGSYSGVMIQNNGGTDMGLFLLNAVENGPSSGSIVLFSAHYVANSVPAQYDSDTYIGSITGLTDASRGGSGAFFGLFHAAANTGNAAGRSMSGQLNLTTSPTSNSETQRIVGTASGRTVSVVIGGGNFATDTGPLVVFAVTGWATSSNAGSVFTLN